MKHMEGVPRHVWWSVHCHLLCSFRSGFTYTKSHIFPTNSLSKNSLRVWLNYLSKVRDSVQENRLKSIVHYLTHICCTSSYILSSTFNLNILSLTITWLLLNLQNNLSSCPQFLIVFFSNYLLSLCLYIIISYAICNHPMTFHYIFSSYSMMHFFLHSYTCSFTFIFEAFFLPEN